MTGRMEHFHFTAKRLRGVICAVVFGFLCFTGTSPAFAQAALNPGCDTDMVTLQKARAEMIRLRDVCINKEIQKPRASLLQLTCFDQAAQYSAREIGNVFSGDFSGDPHFSTAVMDNIQSMLSNFSFDNILNDLGVAITSVFTGMIGGFQCKGVRDVWNAATQQGAETGAPFFTLEELANGPFPPTLGPRIIDCLNTPEATAIRTNYVNAVATAQVRTVTMPAPGSLMGAQTLEEVMTANGTAYTP